MNRNELELLLEEEVNLKKGLLLSEAYFGKSDNLVKASKHLNNIAEKIKKNNYYNPMGSKDLKMVEFCLQKQFNTESVTIIWTPLNSTANAMTFPVSTMVLTTPSSMDIKRTPSSISYKDKSGKHLSILVFSSLVTVSELNGDELMGVILHEIGHNFYMKESYFWIKKLSIISDALRYLFGKKDQNGNPLGLGSLMYILTFGNRFFRGALSNFCDNIPPSDEDTGNIIFKMFDTLTNFNTILGGFVTILTLPASLNPAKFVQSLFGTAIGAYRDEKFSDNFATIHGYGVELSSFIKRMNVTKGMMQGAKIVNESLPKGLASIYNAQIFIVQSILMLCDCHPNNYVRVHDQAKLLQAELKKQDLNPKVKKQILSDLENIESIYESMTESEYFESNNEGFRKLFYSIVGFAGKDRKDIKEIFLSTKDYDWESLKERKDRNKMKGFFLG